MSSIVSLGYIYNLPFTKLAILDNGTNKKQAILPYQSRYYNSSWKKTFKYRLRKR
ncbi:hypothetical protein JCM10003_3452 [Bacteroides pyogenes JCM 10003]|nr:hypothetical protein JCM10003_3452 [Bacteroides pyogenes JCM 10003]